MEGKNLEILGGDPNIGSPSSFTVRMEYLFALNFVWNFVWKTDDGGRG